MVRSLLVAAAAMYLFVSTVGVANADGEDWSNAAYECVVGDPTAGIYECVNQCESNCSAEESTGGLFLSEKKLEDLLQDECDCAALGLKNYKKCLKKITDAFRPALKILADMERIDAGAYPQLLIFRTHLTHQCALQQMN